MSETNPQKRLVSKQEYAQVIRKKAGLYSFGGIAVLLGSLGFGLAIFLLLLGPGAYWLPFHSSFLVPASVILLPVFIALALASKRLVKKARDMEPVQRITDQNAHLLPLQDTLVRGSALPLTIQQAELLRATRAGQETPQEQLLRATVRQGHTEEQR